MNAEAFGDKCNQCTYACYSPFSSPCADCGFDHHLFTPIHGTQHMKIYVTLELLSPYKLTLSQIEHDLRAAEDQIGYNYDYVIKNVEIRPQEME